jgi:hypothetical protein
MSQMYFILTVVGWPWLVVVGICLAIALVRKSKMEKAHGFEVVRPKSDERAEQPARSSS